MKKSTLKYSFICYPCRQATTPSGMNYHNNKQNKNTNYNIDNSSQ